MIDPSLLLIGALVHADEFLNSATPAVEDKQAFDSLMANVDVIAAMGLMDLMGFLPIRRDGVRYRDKWLEQERSFYRACGCEDCQFLMSLTDDQWFRTKKRHWKEDEGKNPDDADYGYKERFLKIAHEEVDKDVDSK